MDVTSGVLERLADPTLLPRLSDHFIKDVHASLEFIFCFPHPEIYSLHVHISNICVAGTSVIMCSIVFKMVM